MECIPLENGVLRLLIAKSFGPRIFGLSLNGGPNLLADLPDLVTIRPDGKPYHFYGGHRLWRSPEHAILSYELEDDPVEIIPLENGLKLTKPVDVESEVGKSIQIMLSPKPFQVIITHQLKNYGEHPVQCAPWAITQFRPGGVAILPMNNVDTGFLPNQNLVLWPYTNLADRHLQLRRFHIRVNANMGSPFKIGFANPVGWLAYWLEGTLFVKSADYNPQAYYPDFGCSSECYCNKCFLELETLAPLTWIYPAASVTHTETWSLYPDVPKPESDQAVQKIIDELGLE
jgi:hypothetical protein